MGLKAMLALIYDEIYAPPGALDADSIVVAVSTTPVSGDMPSAEWHNAFGTAADFSVPASSDMVPDPFNSFGGMDNTFGGSWD